MPDATTLSRLRIDLAEAGLAEAVFAALNAHLEQHGLIIKAGTMIDATLVEADVKRPPMREGEVSERDPAAGFTRRGQRSFFGTKAHLAVDQGTDLIHEGDPDQCGHRRGPGGRCAHLRRRGGCAGGQGL